jgi:hypothetical protein
MYIVFLSNFGTLLFKSLKSILLFRFYFEIAILNHLNESIILSYLIRKSLTSSDLFLLF